MRKNSTKKNSLSTISSLAAHKRSGEKAHISLINKCSFVLQILFVSAAFLYSSLVVVPQNSLVSAACGTYLAPDGLSPSGNITGASGSYTFRWNPVRSTSGQIISPVTYAWRILDVTTNVQTNKDNLTTNSTTFNLVQGHTYRWWVHGTGGCGFGPASVNVTFSLVAPCPAAVAPSSLATGAPNCAPGGGIGLLYNYNRPASYVRTTIRDITTGQTYVSNYNDAGTDRVTVLFTSLQAGHSYSWYSQAFNTCGTQSATVNGPGFSCPAVPPTSTPTPTPRPGCYTDTTYRTSGMTCPVNTVCNSAGSGVIKNPWSAPAGSICCKTGCTIIATPTPTRTRTPTPRPVTNTPTPTIRVNTPTPTRTRTPTPTVAGGGINTPTPTRTRTPTPTIVAGGPTSTRTPTPTIRVNTPTPTRTRTPTPTVAGGGINTPTPTRTRTPTPTTAAGGPTSTRTPTPYHLACSGVSCQRVAGSGSNACAPQGGSCSQIEGGSGSSSCGPYSYTATCTCSGPCCPGTCANGVACGSSQPISGCTDETPQNRPTVSTVTQPDGGSTIHTRYITVNWTFTDNGAGCGRAWGYNCGSNNNSFTLEIDNNSNFSSPTVTVVNVDSLSRTYTTTASDGALTTNTTYYVRVCAENAGQNCSTGVSFQKQAYSGGSYDGDVGENDTDVVPPFTDAGASGSTGTQIVLIPETSPGVDSTCTETISGSPSMITAYACTVTLDNVNSDPDPTQCLRLATTNYNTALYSGVCFNNAGTCDVSTCINIDLDSNGGVTNSGTENVYYIINNDASYYKLKNVSFLTRGQVTSLFPVDILPYDSDDTDSNYLMIGDSATVNESLGSGLLSEDANLGNGLISRKGWENESYSAQTTLSYQRFDDYVKSRKNSILITNLNELKEAQTNRWEGDLAITDANKILFDNKKIMLIVTGTLSMNVSEFIPTNGSTAILASKINFFGESVFATEAEGLFMADTLDFGTSNIPLKVTGNVISTKFQANPRTRSRDENRQPSFFLVFSPDVYINLLEYISTAVYEWKHVY